MKRLILGIILIFSLFFLYSLEDSFHVSSDYEYGPGTMEMDDPGSGDSLP